MSTQKQRPDSEHVRARPATGDDGGDAATLSEQTDIDRMFEFAARSLRNMTENSQTFLRRSRQTGGQ